MMYTIYNAINREDKTYFIGFTKRNIKQNFFRVSKQRGFDYEKFIVKKIDSSIFKDIAIEIVINNIVFGKLFMESWKSLNLRFDQEAELRVYGIRKQYEFFDKEKEDEYSQEQKGEFMLHYGINQYVSTKKRENDKKKLQSIKPKFKILKEKDEVNK